MSRRLQGGVGTPIDPRSLRFVQTQRGDGDAWDPGWEMDPGGGAEPLPMPEDDEPAPVPPAPRGATPEPAPAPGVSRMERDVEPHAVLEAMPKVFHGVRPESLERVIHLFDVFDLFAGDKLLAHGDEHAALVMVLRGFLDVERAGQSRRAKAGEMLGLTTMFGTGVWPVNVTAITDTRLLVLELDAFRTLRASGSSVAQVLEEAGMDMLLASLQAGGQQVRELVVGKPLDDVAPSRGFLGRLAAVVGGGAVRSARVDVARGLLASPAFRNAEPDHLDAIAARAAGAKAQRGAFLLTQGKPANSLFVVVSGAVDVISSVGPREAVHHETLLAGDVLGAWSMLRTSSPWASYVVSQASTLIEIDKLAWVEMAGAGDRRGSVLRLALLRSLTKRLTRVTETVASLRGGHPPRADVVGSADRFTTFHPVGRR